MLVPAVVGPKGLIVRAALLTVLRRWGGHVFNGLALSGLVSSGVSPHDVGFTGSRDPIAGAAPEPADEEPPARESGAVS